MKPVISLPRGQGLVEYALILVLVAIVVVLVLALIGPQVGNVFSQVVEAMNTGPPGGNPFVSMSVSRTGLEGNDVTATVTVKHSVSVKLTNSQNGNTDTVGCSGTCTGTILSAGHLAGTITASSGGYTITATYPAK